MAGEELRIDVGGDFTSALWMKPPGGRACLSLAHGAGAGMRHPFLEAMASELAARGVATLRYQFPYVEGGRRRPDPPARLVTAVRAAAAMAAGLAGGLPLFAGGKSMGGRMTSQAQAASPLPGVRGIVFLGFPLHPDGAPGTARADHLRDVSVPMLFLQGTRDRLARLDLLSPVCAALGPRATLHVVDGADHAFKVPRAQGPTREVPARLASTIAGWMSAHGGEA